MLISASLTVSLSLLSLCLSPSLLFLTGPLSLLHHRSYPVLNRITLIFYFFLFCQGKLGEPESTAQHRCQPPSPLVSIFSPLSHGFFSSSSSYLGRRRHLRINRKDYSTSRLRLFACFLRGSRLSCVFLGSVFSPTETCPAHF